MADAGSGDEDEAKGAPSDADDGAAEGKSDSSDEEGVAEGGRRIGDVVDGAALEELIAGNERRLAGDVAPANDMMLLLSFLLAQRRAAAAERAQGAH